MNEKVKIVKAVKTVKTVNEMEKGNLYLCNGLARANNKQSKFVISIFEDRCIDVLHLSGCENRGKAPWGLPDKDFFVRYQVKSLTKEENPEYYL